MENQIELTETKGKPQSNNIYDCSQCSYKTTRAYNLQRHIAKHVEKPPKELQHICPFSGCSFATLRWDHLKRHILSVHRAPQDEAVEEELPASATKKILKNKAEKPKGIRQTDVKSKENYKRAPPKLFKCPQCTYRTNRAYNVQRHLIQHVEYTESEQLLHVCVISGCGFSTMRWDHLNRHIKRVHPDAGTLPPEELPTEWPVYTQFIINLDK